MLKKKMKNNSHYKIMNFKTLNYLITTFTLQKSMRTYLCCPNHIASREVKDICYIAFK